MTNETKEKLVDLIEYAIDDLHACMLDAERGEQGAERDMFLASQRFECIGNACAGILPLLK